MRKTWMTAHMYRIGIMMLGLLWITTYAGAAVYHVAKTGDDTTGDGSLSNPWESIRVSLPKLVAGDTLFVHEGTYQEPITDLIPSGTSDTNRTRLSAAIITPGTGNLYNTVYEPVIITSFFKGASTAMLHFRSQTSHHITVEGLILDGAGVRGNGINMYHTGGEGNPDTNPPCQGTGSTATASHHIRVLNVELRNMVNQGLGISQYTYGHEFLNMNVHHNGKDIGSDHGIYIAGPHTIDGGEYHHNATYGIHYYHNGGQAGGCHKIRNPIAWSGGRINGVRAYGNCSGGVILSGWTRDTLITNSLMYGNGGTKAQARCPDSGGNAGLIVGSSAGGSHEAYNNTMWGNVGNSTKLLQFGCMAIYKNNITQGLLNETDNAGACEGSGPAVLAFNQICTGASCPDGFPQFIDATNGDFRIPGTSPLVNVGTDLTSVGVTADFIGTPRPQGAAYDIGAYEFITGTTPFNYSLSSTGDQTVAQGASIAPVITATKLAGTATPVTFSASGLPTGATISFSPTNCTPTTPCTTTATLQTALTTPQGVFNVTVRGTAGSLVRSTTFNLTVTCGS